MRTALVLVAGFLAGSCLAGCVRSSVEMLSPARFPATLPESVTVYVSVADVEAQHLVYERVAMLFIRADALFTNEAAIMRRAREDAAKVGANGVILGDAREPGFFLWSSDRQARVFAIRTRPRPPS
jgi:hypothetical protein